MAQQDNQHRARKRFGQNFLHDQGVIHSIARTINATAKQHVVEIGPGQGALTADILAGGCRLDAIELDRDLIPILQQRFANQPNFSLQQGDALTFDFASLASDGEKLRVVGNLPYNISTPLIFRLLDQHQLIADMHFMLQLEVVNRLAATPGSKNYGRLSVMTQYYCEVQSLFEVPCCTVHPPWPYSSQLVGAFQTNMDTTAIDAVSPAFRSEFGWHILQVLDRRDKDVSDDIRRRIAGNYIHQRKYNDELQTWLQKIRDEAYVDLK